jgi:exopolyphosphatase/guanosine-5'-triphosphate,3'-diphosphate pyrophosphatase
MSERVAIIDLGSNSARLIIMQIFSNGAYNLIYHQKETVRLSEGIQTSNLLQEDAMARAIVTLQSFAHMCQLYGADKILAVGTAAIRNTKNGAEFAKKIQNQTGIALKPISGEAEATLGYLGVMNTIDSTDALLFDLGGASTELTLIRNRKAEKVISLPFGAVNLTERFQLQGKVNEEQIVEMSAFIRKEISRVSWVNNLAVPLIGIGGTARAIAKMDQKRKNYPFPKVHNYRMGSMSFRALWKDTCKLSFAQRRKLPGLSTERADIIIAGLGIVSGLFDAANSQQLIVSGCGVREGLFMQYYLAQNSKSEVVNDPLLHSAHNMLLFYNCNIEHAYHVAKLAESLFDQCKDQLELEPRHKTLLKIAALLHDTGVSINYYDHYRHSNYLVENARLFGLSHREQIMTAIITGWHHGPSVRFEHNRIYNEFLDTANWYTTRKLAMLLALAESLDTTQRGLVEKVTLKFAAPDLRLFLNTKGSIPLELESVNKHCKWLKKDFGLTLMVEVQNPST